MNFLDGLFERKDASSPVARATAGNGMALYQYTAPHKWDTEEAVTKGYERTIWVFRCVDAIAENASKLPVVVRQGNHRDGKIVNDDVIHRLFNMRPNSYETAKQFRYRVSSQLLLARSGVFIEVVPNRYGRAAELHLLPPHMVTPLPDAKNFISGFQVRDVRGVMTVLPPERVIWLRAKPHPTDPYAQMTPLVAAGLAADTDYLARLFNRTYLQNGGQTGLLVGISGMPSNDDAKEVKSRFHGGPQNAGRVTVVGAEDIKVAELGGSPHDAMWVESLKMSKDDILIGFGTPESVLGNASGRTYDNADAENEAWWDITVLPHMDACDAGYDVLTVGGIEDDLFVSHDISMVDVLQRHQRNRADRALAEYQAGTRTLDQYLLAVGRPPLNVPGSRIYWVPANGRIPVAEKPEDVDAVAQLPIIGQPAPTDPAEAARQGALEGVRRGQDRAMSAIAARAEQLAIGSKSIEERVEHKAITSREHADDPEDDPAIVETKTLRGHGYGAERIRTEAHIEGILGSWSDRQGRACKERLGGPKARKGTRHSLGDPGTKALDSGSIVDADRWADDVVDALQPVIERLAAKWAKKAAMELKNNDVIERMHAAGEGHPKGRTTLDQITGGGVMGRESTVGTTTTAVMDMIRESARNQATRIQEKIAKMDADGKTLDEIRAEIDKMTGTRSSWKRGLSRAVTTSTIEGVRNAVFNHAGRFATRTWNTMHDERVRPSHGKANGQKREGGKPFNVGGARLMYPGDPTAPIEETGGCRCWTTIEPAYGPVVARVNAFPISI